MGLYKRKGSKTYHIDFIRADGIRIRRSAKTTNKSEAMKLYDNLKSESWNVGNGFTKIKYSWKEAVVRYRKDKKHIKSQDFITRELIHLDKHLNGMDLSDITVDVINNIKYSRLEDTYQRRPGGKIYSTAGNTVNKTLAILKAVLRRAQKWQWLDNVPLFDFVQIRKDMKSSFNWLKHEEVERVLKELPPHLQYLMKFSLATGLRESNVTGLEWKNVNIKLKYAYVDAINSKNSDSIRIPLNDDAMEILLSLKGKHETNVFSYKGKIIRKANAAAWRKALDRAGIRAYCPSVTAGIKVNEMYPTKETHEYSHPNFRWHDLRHTWASWHVQAGTPLLQLQALGGWKSYEMVLRYAHLGSSHIDKCANNISLKK